MRPLHGIRGRLAAVPTEEGLVWRDLWLLRVRALLRGGVLAWGRRPWLGLRFNDHFANP